MKIRNEILSILNEKRFGTYEFNVNLEIIEQEKLERCCATRLEYKCIYDVHLNEDRNILVFRYVNVKNIVDSIIENIDTLSDNYREGIRINEIIDMELIEESNLLSYLNLFENFGKRVLVRNRLNGFKYTVNDEGLILRERGYDYILKFISKKNVPYVEFTSPFNNDISKFFVPYKQGVVYGEDKIVFPFKYLDAFKESNKIDSDRILVSDQSIKSFYSFERGGIDKYAISLTPKFVSKWWDYDCPKLWKYYPNVDDSINMWGLRFNVFSNVLVDWSFHGVEIDEDVTKEEVDILSKNHENTDIATNLKLTYEANSLSEDDKKQIISDIEQYESIVGAAINENLESALEATCIRLIGEEKYVQELKMVSSDGNDKIDVLKNILSKNEPCALDCGFLYFYPSYSSENNDIRDKYIKARGLLDGRPWDSIKVPNIWNGQSTTIKRIIAEELIKRIKSNNNINLRYSIVMD